MLDLMLKKVLILALLAFGCQSAPPDLGHYSIGKDPSWFPMRLEEWATPINGFAGAVVQELAEVEHRPFKMVDVAWNQLFEGLEEKDYDAVLTTLPPNVMSLSRFDFSEPLMLLGPVLVVAASSSVTSLEEMRGKIVSVNPYDDSVLIAQSYPLAAIEMYESVPTALEEVQSGEVDGALIPFLDAYSLVDTRFASSLRVATPPLSDKGIRLITLKGENREVIEHFNEGLKRMKRHGDYNRLWRKYNLPGSS